MKFCVSTTKTKENDRFIQNVEEIQITNKLRPRLKP